MNNNQKYDFWLVVIFIVAVTSIVFGGYFSIPR